MFTPTLPVRQRRQRQQQQARHLSGPSRQRKGSSTLLFGSWRAWALSIALLLLLYMHVAPRAYAHAAALRTHAYVRHAYVRPNSLLAGTAGSSGCHAKVRHQGRC